MNPIEHQLRDLNVRHHAVHVTLSELNEAAIELAAWIGSLGDAATVSEEDAAELAPQIDALASLAARLEQRYPTERDRLFEVLEDVMMTLAESAPLLDLPRAYPLGRIFTMRQTFAETIDNGTLIRDTLESFERERPGVPASGDAAISAIGRMVELLLADMKRLDDIETRVAARVRSVISGLE